MVSPQFGLKEKHAYKPCWFHAFQIKYLVFKVFLPNYWSRTYYPEVPCIWLSWSRLFWCHEMVDDVIDFFAESPGQKVVLQNKTIFWKISVIKLCIKIFRSTQSEGYQPGIAREALQLKEIKRWGYIWISCIQYPTRFSAIFTCSGHCRLIPRCMMTSCTTMGCLFLTFCWQRLYRKPCFVCIKTI